MLLLVMIIVLIVQDVVVTSLLLGDRTSSATVNEAARLVLILTILEFTAFSNIFCRLLPPERFAQLSRSTSSGNVAALKFGNCGPVRLPLLSFIGAILDPRTMFSVGKKCEPVYADPAKVVCFQGDYLCATESKRDDDLYNEHSPLVT